MIGKYFICNYELKDSTMSPVKSSLVLLNFHFFKLINDGKTLKWGRWHAEDVGDFKTIYFIFSNGEIQNQLWKDTTYDTKSNYIDYRDYRIFYFDSNSDMFDYSNFKFKYIEFKREN